MAIADQIALTDLACTHNIGDFMGVGKNQLTFGVALRFFVVHYSIAGVNAIGAVQGTAGEGNGLYQRLQIVRRGNRRRSTHRSLFETFLFSGVARSANVAATR